MQISEIYSFLDELSPFELQESWDNSGLLVGGMQTEVEQIALSIDVDEELIDMLDENTLLITHHPIIFGGLKQLDFCRYPANLLQKMIKKNISNIAMHTNFDQTHLNDYVAKEVLGYEVVRKDGFISYLKVHQSFDDFVQKVSNALNLSHIKSVRTTDYIDIAALVTGSGCSLINAVNADCFLTGDIKYHDAMEAKSINLSMIDIGHFESEQFFAQILLQHLKILGLEVIISSSKNPFTYENPKGKQ